MRQFKPTQYFNCDEAGAVTFDWVVLTTATLDLGTAVLASVSGGTSKPAT